MEEKVKKMCKSKSFLQDHVISIKKILKCFSINTQKYESMWMSCLIIPSNIINFCLHDLTGSSVY